MRAAARAVVAARSVAATAVAMHGGGEVAVVMVAAVMGVAAMGLATETAVTAGAAMAAEAKVAVVSWSRQLEPSAGAVAVRTELRDAVAEPVPLRRDVAGAGKLERSTGRGHIRAASAETARWQWPRWVADSTGRHDLRLARTHRRPGRRGQGVARGVAWLVLTFD